MQRIKEIGCIACRKEGRLEVPCEVHHVLDGGRRMGHDHTVGLCPWHHRGEAPLNMPATDEVAFFYGPSMALHRRRFDKVYGSQSELVRIQDRFIAELEDNTIGATT
jgi:hypothetical protein